MDYQNLILNTKSVREYKKESIDTQKLKTIKDYAQNCIKIDDNIKIDVRILSNNEAYIPLYGIAGYKGNMIDAPHYILILSEKNTLSDNQAIKDNLNILSDKEVVALIALGYDANAPQKGSITSFHTDCKIDLDEMVYIDKWGNGADASVLEQRGLLEAFAFSKFAPSALNGQPWRFLLTGGKAILAIKKDRNTNTYEQKIDTGIIMFVFQAIVSSTLFDLKWKLEQPVDFIKIPKEFEIVGYCMV